jgi:hypothetical protein
LKGHRGNLDLLIEVPAYRGKRNMLFNHKIQKVEVQVRAASAGAPKK